MAILISSFKNLLSCSLLSLLFLSSFESVRCSNQGEDAIKSNHFRSSTHLLVQISSLLSTYSCKPSAKGTQKKGASLKLVHKYGPCSHLSSKQPNSLDFTQILLADQSRVQSIRSRLAKAVQKDLLDSAVRLPAQDGSAVNSGNYVITVGLGTPKKDLTLIFDTGSDLTWTQCQPCSRYCHTQVDPIFNPANSKTYTNISCNSALCSQLESTTGVSPSCSTSTCIYGIQYGDQSFSVGFFGKEKMTLTPTDSIDNFYFGCGQNNQGLFGGSAGLLGLGRDKLSFVSQTAQKYGKVFSYCLPSTPSSTGHLTFGKIAFPKTVKFTQLLTKSQYPSFYFIELIGISVSGKKLSIPTSVFSTSGTLIDSGTVITRMQPTAYTALKTAFRQGMTKYATAPALSILDTCYDFSKYDSVIVPQVSFFFSGGTEMSLDASGILYAQNKSQVCLAVAPNSDDSDVAIFGNVQQKTFDIVYDVTGGRLGFGARGCS